MKWQASLALGEKKWSRAKANRVLPRECTGHKKHPLPQHKRRLHMDITRWSIPKSDWLYSLKPKMEKLYAINKNKTGIWLCSEHELLIAKLRLKLKKVGKTNRPFRYYLNQIPYNYTVEVRNRFKGFDLIYRVSEELWPEACDTIQEAVIKTIPKKKKCKKGKWLSEEGLQIAEKREAKGKGENKDIPIWMQSSKE